MCASRSSDRALTASQQRHLVGLLAAGAVSRETGAWPLRDAVSQHFPEGFSPLVAGKLRDFGMADSRGVRKHGQAWTEYWLTELGRAEAERIRDGAVR